MRERKNCWKNEKKRRNKEIGRRGRKIQKERKRDRMLARKNKAGEGKKVERAREEGKGRGK